MADDTFLAHGPRVAIRRITVRDHAEIDALARASAALHAPWVPRWEHTPESFAAYVERFDHPTHKGFVICLHETGAVVGGVNINNIVRGTIQSGSLGYAAYAPTTGRGYMTEGLRLVMAYAFDDLGLHRLEANIQPANVASIRLVERLGFEREGYSPRFQYLDGAWRGHERWAVTAEMALGDPRDGE